MIMTQMWLGYFLIVVPNTMVRRKKDMKVLFHNGELSIVHHRSSVFMLDWCFCCSCDDMYQKVASMHGSSFV